jgi:hypothetical protein
MDIDTFIHTEFSLFTAMLDCQINPVQLQLMAEISHTHATTCIECTQCSKSQHLMAALAPQSFPSDIDEQVPKPRYIKNFSSSCI